MLKQCEEGKISKSDLTEIVHIIVNEMRNVREYIPYKAFRTVAKKISDKYPAAFIDKDEDGTFLGDGMHGIVSKMHIRNIYLNRRHKTVVPPKKLQQQFKSGLL